mmetsp:Transcript_15119/g.21099  ORF Transcript_15119/g.21099 Transcript_15119/m.21099 type:complete len:318 (+) Transcript_15119:45-998(+)
MASPPPSTPTNPSTGQYYVHLAKQYATGIKDALAFFHVYKVYTQSAPARKALKDIVTFNALICFVNLAIFQYISMPWINRMLSISVNSDNILIWLLSNTTSGLLFFIFLLGWMVPTFLFSFILNGKWLAVVSEEAIKLLTKRQVKKDIASLFQVPKEITNELYTTTFYAMFVLQSFICFLIPFVGSIANLLVLCWLYSLYCFEYKWSHWNIGRRLAHIENNWAYFAGFGIVVGLPFTLASYHLGFWIGYTVWWLLFPLFIITAVAAKKPQKVVTQEGSSRMRLFVFAQWLNAFTLNFLVKVIKIVSGGTQMEEKKTQ